jgi:hypothetical protein
MSENLPAPRPQMLAGGPVAALVPQSLEEAFRVSSAIAASGMAPRGIDKAEQIMVAIMAGAELGLAPFQSLQSFAVVNGRPTLWGDGLLAVVRGRGVRVREWLEGDGDGMVAHCECTRPDTGEQIERSFSVADAKKAQLWAKQGPWQQYPKRMLQMRARALSLRDGCADMLRGIQVREEVEDFRPIRDVTPERTGLAARLAANKGGPSEGFTASQAHDAETGEVIDEPAPEIEAEVEPDPDAPTVNVLEWAQTLEEGLPYFSGVDELRADWDVHKAALRDADPERFRTLNLAIAKRAQEIGEAGATGE